MNWQKTAQKLRTWLSEEGLLHLVTYRVTDGYYEEANEHGQVAHDIVSVWWSDQVIAMERVTSNCGRLVVSYLETKEEVNV